MSKEIECKIHIVKFYISPDFFFLLNLTSYSTTLRVISSGGGLELNGLKKYVDRRKFSVFVMVSELLERAEERRDGTEKDFLRFWRGGREKK